MKFDEYKERRTKYKHKWTTLDKRVLKANEFDDNHLVNTIKYIQKAFEKISGKKHFNMTIETSSKIYSELIEEADYRGLAYDETSQRLSNIKLIMKDDLQ